MKRSVLREYFESLVIAVVLALFVRTWVFQAFKIPSGSMEKNLLIGDHLIVNKMQFAPTLTGFERAVMPRRGPGADPPAPHDAVHVRRRRDHGCESRHSV